MADAVEPCEHVVRLLRAVRDGLAACPRCGLYAEKVGGKLKVRSAAGLSKPSVYKIAEKNA